MWWKHKCILLSLKIFSALGNLDWRCWEVDIIRKVQQSPYTHCPNWHHKPFPLSNTHQLQVVVLQIENST